MPSDDWKDAPQYNCPNDRDHKMESRCVESSCGGFDDYKFRCKDCGETWWAEGPDA